MRSPLWFVVAGLIALAGFAGALFYLMPRLAVADAQMMRVVVPGGAVLTLDTTGFSVSELGSARIRSSVRLASSSEIA